MLRICKSFIASYTSRQMYTLVNDISSYKYFLPKCKDSRVIYANSELMEAELTVSALGNSYKFITKNNLVADKSITINLVEGPFKYLHGQWLFEPTGMQKCNISLNLNFKMKNIFLQMAMHPIIDIMVETMFDSFKSRANVIFNG